MTYHLQQGDLTMYRNQFLEAHPHLNRGNLPTHVMEAFEDQMPSSGLTLEEAFERILSLELPRKLTRTRAAYRCNFCRLFLWISDQVGEQFIDCTDTEGMTIQYSLTEGIISWK